MVNIGCNCRRTVRINMIAADYVSSIVITH